MRKDTLTTFEIADHCQVTHRSVQQWIATGKLKSFRTPGNHSRVMLSDFIEFLKTYKMPIPSSLEYLTRVKKRILIVDDDTLFVALAKKIINLADRYEVDVAYDGFAAGKKFVEFKPDLVTLDINMPRLDGLSACKQIREEEGQRKAKILIISGTEMNMDSAKLAQVGADGFLSKPFSSEELISSVERLIC